MNIIYNIDEFKKIFKLKENIVKQKDIEYFNDALAFDIETTNTIVNDHKIAFMYVWQLAFEDGVIVGRKWEEFIECINFIIDKYDLNVNRRVVIYIHNMEFEFSFLCRRFDWEEVFSIDSRRPARALTKDGIEFRCSYINTGKRLEDVAKDITKTKITKKVGDLNYNLIRNSKTPLTEEEIGYCINDVIILYKYYEEQIEKEGAVFNIPMTKTGYIRRLTRNKTLFNEDGSINNSYKNMIKRLQLSKELYNLMKAAYYGGFSHANYIYIGDIINNVKSYDFCSSYIAVMLTEKFPMTPGKFITAPKTKKEFIKLLNNYACVFDIEFTNLRVKEDVRDGYISKSDKCFIDGEVVVNNGRVMSAEKLNITITEIDMQVIIRCYDYDNIKLGRFWVAKKDYLPKEFIEVIQKLYYDKTRLKGVEGMEIEYAFIKSLLNSLYGMCVMDPVRECVEFDAEAFETIEQHILDKDVEEREPFNNTKPDLEDALNKYNNSFYRFLWYPWGVYIAAYARRNLWTGIIELGDDYIYSDTDSLKFKNYEKHVKYFSTYNELVETKLKNNQFVDFEKVNATDKNGVKHLIGIWDPDGDYTRFKTLGAKRYITESYNKKGELKINITIAGLPKSAVNYINKDNNAFDFFNHDMEIPEQCTGKLCKTYIDFRISGYITDYLGNTDIYDEYSAVHLGPAPFTLSLNKNFIEFLQGYKDQVITN